MSSKLQINVNGKCRCYNIVGSAKHWPNEGGFELPEVGDVTKYMGELYNANVDGDLSMKDGWNTGDVVEMIRTRQNGESTVKGSFTVKTKERQLLDRYLYLYRNVTDKSMELAGRAERFQSEVAKANPSDMVGVIEYNARKLARAQGYSKVFGSILDDDLNIDLLPQEDQLAKAGEYTERLQDKMKSVYKYFLEEALFTMTAESTSPIHNAMFNTARDGQSEAVRDLGRLLSK